jgi:hypothetical protein
VPRSVSDDVVASGLTGSCQADTIPIETPAFRSCDSLGSSESVNATVSRNVVVRRVQFQACLSVLLLLSSEYCSARIQVPCLGVSQAVATQKVRSSPSRPVTRRNCLRTRRRPSSPDLGRSSQHRGSFLNRCD